MTTAANLTATFNFSTDALFRTACQWIHDQFTAFGWVQTADTGQINLTTVAKPTGAGVFMGYEIWRMADALQGTNPCFAKIEYGSSPYGATVPAVAVTIGTGSNGSGTISNGGTRAVFGASVAPTGSANHLYGSGDTNRICFAFSIETASACSFFFSIERTKADDGTDTADGLHLCGAGANASVADGGFSQAIPFSGAIPANETRLCQDFPVAAAQVSGVYGSDIYTYSIKPMMFYPRNPIMSFVVFFVGDLTLEVPVNLDIYGANHTYLPCGQTGLTFIAYASGRSVTRLAMRYE